MFHPHQGALAYTEPLIVPGLLAAPVRWFGGSALLAHNLLVLFGFTLTALAVYALVRIWTRDHVAGLLSGVLFAFSTVFQTRVAHLQALHAYWLPLAFIAFHHLMTQRRTRDAVWLGSCVFGAALTSGYLVVFVCFALAAAAAVRVREFGRRDGARLALRLGAAATVTLAALLVVLRPYMQARYQRPPVAEATDVATALSSYLASAALLHYETWSGDYYHSAPGTLFPGVVTLVLAGAALLRRRSGAPRGVRRMLAAVAGIGCLMSLGSLTPVYVWAYDVVPPLQGLRAINRFGVLVAFAVGRPGGHRLQWIDQVRLGPPARSRPGGRVVAGHRGELPRVRILSPVRLRHARPQVLGRVLAWPGAVVELPIFGPSRVSPQRALPSRVDGALASPRQRVRWIRAARLRRDRCNRRRDVPVGAGRRVAPGARRRLRRRAHRPLSRPGGFPAGPRPAGPATGSRAGGHGRARDACTASAARRRGPLRLCALRRTSPRSVSWMAPPRAACCGLRAACGGRSAFSRRNGSSGTGRRRRRRLMCGCGCPSQCPVACWTRPPEPCCGN